MGLTTIQLEAFAAVAKHKSFSAAGRQLHVTQSALSQRVKNLEDDLETALFVRGSAGPTLTTAGEDLLRYWRVRESLEQDVMTSIKGSNSFAGGIVRIAGFSSVVRSVLIPVLSPLMQSQSEIRAELLNREIDELPQMLSSNQVDFIITTRPPFRSDLESLQIGTEVNVLVTSGKTSSNPMYLDHDMNDQTTAEFIKLNPRLGTHCKRHFLDEVYALVDGVRLGWGHAVLPKHLVKSHPELEIARGLKPLKIPVFLQYIRQPYYSKIQDLVREILLKEAKKLF